MNYNDKEYIVHCPAEEDSRAVQERMFEMGGTWVCKKQGYYVRPVDTYGVNTAIRLKRDGVVRFAYKSFYEREGYTVLSPQEFLSQTAQYSKKEQQTMPEQNITQLPEKFFVRTPTQEMFDEVNKMLVEYFEEGKVCPPYCYDTYEKRSSVCWEYNDFYVGYAGVGWCIEEGWPEVSYDTLKCLWLERCSSQTKTSGYIDASLMEVNTIKNTAPPPLVTKDEWINNRIEYLTEYVSNADLFEDGGVDALEELAALIRQRKRGEV